MRVTLLVNIRQGKARKTRNRETERKEDGKQQPSRSGRQCRKQHRRQTEENSHAPNVSCRSHSAILHSKAVPTNNLTPRIFHPKLLCHCEVAVPAEESLSHSRAAVFSAGLQPGILALVARVAPMVLIGETRGFSPQEPAPPLPPGRHCPTSPVTRLFDNTHVPT